MSGARALLFAPALTELAAKETAKGGREAIHVGGDRERGLFFSVAKGSVEPLRSGRV